MSPNTSRIWQEKLPALEKQKKDQWDNIENLAKQNPECAPASWPTRAPCYAPPGTPEGDGRHVTSRGTTCSWQVREKEGGGGILYNPDQAVAA